MTPILFITATNTDIGKSYVTTELLHAFHSAGINVGVIKPIETGVDEHALDASLHLKTIQQLNTNYAPLRCDDIAPIQFKLPAAPFVAKHEHSISLQQITDAIAKHQTLCDLLIVEGAGGTMVPIEIIEGNFYYMSDLMKAVATHTLLIGHGRLGCMSDILCNMTQLQQKDVAFTAMLNVLDDDIASFEAISLPFFESFEEKIYLYYKEKEALIHTLRSRLNLI